MFKNATLFALFALVLTTSCKKEKTVWDTNWSAPLAYGRLTLNDLIDEENLQINSDGYLSLVIHESVLEFSIDTLIKLPDTTIVTKTAIGIPSLEISPSFSLPDVYDQAFELGDIELKKIIIESGLADAKIESPWKGKTKVTITFPKVTKSGVPLERIYYLDAGSPESLAIAEDLIDMGYYHMELRGLDDTEFNTLGINVTVESNEDADVFTVTNSDSIAFSFQFRELVARYAKGYFGQYHLTDTVGFSLAPLKKVIDGSIDIDSIDLKISIMNGFNLIAQAKITKLTALNTRTGNTVEFDFAEKNSTININPASGGYYDYVPSVYPIFLNNTNTNIVEFLENLSDSVIIGYELDINPFGNITAGNDEFFPDSKMQLFLDGEFPLNFGANDLTLQDTMEIDFVETGAIDPKKVYASLLYTNGFPLGADLKIYLLDENKEIIDSILTNTPLQPGIYNEVTYATNPSEGQVNFDLDEGILTSLQDTKQLILTIAFNSYNTEKIKINADAFIDFKLKSNLKIRISI